MKLPMEGVRTTKRALWGRRSSPAGSADRLLAALPPRIAWGEVARPAGRPNDARPLRSGLHTGIKDLSLYALDPPTKAAGQTGSPIRDPPEGGLQRGRRIPL